MDIVTCTQCQKRYIPPQYTCFKCGGTTFSPAEIKGRGSVDSFTTIWVAPEKFMDQVPYHVIVVTMEDGLRVTGRLGGPAEGLVLDAPVEFTEKNDIGYWFRLL